MVGNIGDGGNVQFANPIKDVRGTDFGGTLKLIDSLFENNEGLVLYFSDYALKNVAGKIVVLKKDDSGEYQPCTKTAQDALKQADFKDKRPYHVFHTLKALAALDLQGKHFNFATLVRKVIDNCVKAHSSAVRRTVLRLVTQAEVDKLDQQQKGQEEKASLVAELEEAITKYDQAAPESKPVLAEKVDLLAKKLDSLGKKVPLDTYEANLVRRAGLNVIREGLRVDTLRKEKAQAKAKELELIGSYSLTQLANVKVDDKDAAYLRALGRRAKELVMSSPLTAAEYAGLKHLLPYMVLEDGAAFVSYEVPGSDQKPAQVYYALANKDKAGQWYFVTNAGDSNNFYGNYYLGEETEPTVYLRKDGFDKGLTTVKQARPKTSWKLYYSQRQYEILHGLGWQDDGDGKAEATEFTGARDARLGRLLDRSKDGVIDAKETNKFETMMKEWMEVFASDIPAKNRYKYALKQYRTGVMEGIDLDAARQEKQHIDKGLAELGIGVSKKAIEEKPLRIALLRLDCSIGAREEVVEYLKLNPGASRQDIATHLVRYAGDKLAGVRKVTDKRIAEALRSRSQIAAHLLDRFAEARKTAETSSERASDIDQANLERYVLKDLASTGSQEEFVRVAIFYLTGERIGTIKVNGYYSPGMANELSRDPKFLKLSFERSLAAKAYEQAYQLATKLREVSHGEGAQSIETLFNQMTTKDKSYPQALALLQKYPQIPLRGSRAMLLVKACMASNTPVQWGVARRALKIIEEEKDNIDYQAKDQTVSSAWSTDNLLEDPQSALIRLGRVLQLDYTSHTAWMGMGLYKYSARAEGQGRDRRVVGEWTVRNPKLMTPKALDKTINYAKKILVNGTKPNGKVYTHPEKQEARLLLARCLFARYEYMAKWADKAAETDRETKLAKAHAVLLLAMKVYHKIITPGEDGETIDKTAQTDTNMVSIAQGEIVQTLQKIRTAWETRQFISDRQLRSAVPKYKRLARAIAKELPIKLEVEVKNNQRGEQYLSTNLFNLRYGSVANLKTNKAYKADQEIFDRLTQLVGPKGKGTSTPGRQRRIPRSVGRVASKSARRRRTGTSKQATQGKRASRTAVSKPTKPVNPDKPASLRDDLAAAFGH